MIRNIKRIRQRLIDSIGVRATHAAEDGATIGAIFGLALTYPPAVALVCLAVFGDGLKPKKVLKHADELVRQDDITAQPAYFVGGFLGSTIVGVAVGVLLRLTARWSGVSVPDLVSILLGV